MKSDCLHFLEHLREFSTLVPTCYAKTMTTSLRFHFPQILICSVIVEMVRWLVWHACAMSQPLWPVLADVLSGKEVCMQRVNAQDSLLVITVAQHSIISSLSSTVDSTRVTLFRNLAILAIKPASGQQGFVLLRVHLQLASLPTF